MNNITQLINKTHNLKLLYAEDDAILREATLDIFEDFFSDVYTAENGQEGLEIFKNNTIDFIITDINMPIMDGIDMIKNIRDNNQQVPIVVFSAHNEQNIVDEIEQHNIQGYLYKPMQYEQFIKKLNELFNV